MRFIHDNEKGAAMVIAIMVVFVLFILGTALWQYSVSDTIHVARDEKRLQAYYLARTGAEAAYNAWEESAYNNKPAGETVPMYLDTSTDEFTQDSTTDNKGSFTVTITNTGNTTSIKSTGRVDDVTQTVEVLISASYQYGDTLNWYRLPSGQVDPGVYKATGAIILGPNPDSSQTANSLKNPASGSASYTAQAMFFYYPIDTANSDSLTLTAETIVFEEDLIFGNNGKMILKVYPGKERGIVFFSDVYGQNKNDPLFIANKAYYFYGDDIGEVNVHALKTEDDVQAAIQAGEIELVEEPVKPGPDAFYTVIWN